MALLFQFDTLSAITKGNKYLKAPDTLGKVQKSLAAKKVPKPHIDKFMTQYANCKVSSQVEDANQYIRKNMVATGLAPVTKDPNILEKAFLVAIFGPQKLILMAKFQLSIHLKGNNLELQYTSCKGESKTLLTSSP